MIQTVIRSKKMLIILGAVLVLLLAVACGSDSDNDGESVTGITANSVGFLAGMVLRWRANRRNLP